MAEAVVDLLETIEIDEHDRERVVRPFGAGESLLESVVEQSTVGKVRQAVVERLMAQLLLEPHALGDVTSVEDDTA